MNLRTVFKAQSIVLLLNAIGGLFLTATFMTQANFAVTADLITRSIHGNDIFNYFYLVLENS